MNEGPMPWKLAAVILYLVIASPAYAQPLRVLALGDSITHGIAARGADGGYSYRSFC
jgi:hypothetical protein